MAIEFKRAERKNTNLLLSLAGPSGCGKTLSACKIAAGICGDEPFLMIDTEGDRGLHYADTHEFEHQPLGPPFRPERYVELIEAGVKRGFQCIVIDSMSHEWAGEGGILDMADADKAKPPSNWIRPKKAHKKFVNALIQARTNLVMCLRAEEKINVVDDPNRPGKKIVVPAGWQPICERRLPYEMTLSLLMLDTAPGVVDLSLPHKLQDQHRLAFQPGRHIDSEGGTLLGKWARGEQIPQPDLELWQRIRSVSHEGKAELIEAVKFLDDAQKAAIQPIKQELWANAKRADANRSGDELGI